MSLFDNPLMGIPLMFGMISVIIGLIFLAFPPRNRNWFYGYRTTRAMKDQNHWEFAQRYSAKQMLLSGLASMAFSSIGWIFEWSEGVEVTIGLIWIVLVSILLIYRTEQAMIKEFGS